jgi:predicted acyltransferase
MATQNEQEKRLLSLDALRGFDMLFIMGFSGLITLICALFPGGTDCYLAQTMHHVKWNGLYHHDTIFPLFLFIAGISFPFSYAKQTASGLSRGKMYVKVIKRMFILIALGVVYNGFFKMDFATLRICSVLGRIGMAWGLAALLYMNFNTKVRAYISAAILLGYWLVVCYIPAPDAAGASALSLEGNIVGYIDRLITPGRLHNKTFDPEGLLSTLPAVVTAMLGMFTGEFVRKEGIDGSKKAGYMGLASIAMLAVGLLWSLVFPVNKSLWTSSFVLVVGSYSLAMFALFYFIIDVKGWKKWTLPFTVIGMNSITIYMAQRIIPFRKISGFFLDGIAAEMPEYWAKILLSAGALLVSWLFLYFLYRKKTFLKV